MIGTVESQTSGSNLIMSSSAWTNSDTRSFLSSDQSGVSLNIYEVELNQDRLLLWGIPYSDAMFDSLRSNGQLTDFFFYRFEKTLYAWERRKTAQTLPTGFQQETVSLNEHAPVIRKIVEQSIVEILSTSRLQSLQRQVLIKLGSHFKKGKGGGIRRSFPDSDDGIFCDQPFLN
jgi:hypothetical protein